LGKELVSSPKMDTLETIRVARGVLADVIRHGMMFVSLPTDR